MRLVLAFILVSVAVSCTTGSSARTAPLRIGLFVGVDGVTYSSDGSKFGLYGKYADRELVRKVPAEELVRLVSRLTEAGLLNEKPPRLDVMKIPPQTYEVRIQWADHEYHCRWYHSHHCVGGCHVPSKYLDILDDVPVSWRADLPRKFVDQNRELIDEEKTPKRN